MQPVALPLAKIYRPKPMITRPISKVMQLKMAKMVLLTRTIFYDVNLWDNSFLLLKTKGKYCACDLSLSLSLSLSTHTHTQKRRTLNWNVIVCFGWFEREKDTGKKN